mmetsp:Transcript_16604/g.33447  ORF Transcript_16604/g.33447 Transcript_16604/m.33447 type:complete len:130 (+) Transcript_16604:154-543(+)
MDTHEFSTGHCFTDTRDCQDVLRSSVVVDVMPAHISNGNVASHASDSPRLSLAVQILQHAQPTPPFAMEPMAPLPPATLRSRRPLGRPISSCATYVEALILVAPAAGQRNGFVSISTGVIACCIRARAR